MPLIKPEHIDLAVFFTIALANIKFNIWPMIMPYYYSLAKHYNPAITMKTIFNAIICMYMGSSLSTLVFPTILFIMGLKGTILFGGLVAVINNVAIYSFSSVAWICISSALVGFGYKHFTTVIILYFSDKYPSSASKLYSMATSGFVVTGCFWANMITCYTNPGNEEMTELTWYNGYEERYFSFEIASRLSGALNIISLFIMSNLIAMSFFFSNPVKYGSNFRLLVG